MTLPDIWTEPFTSDIRDQLKLEAAKLFRKHQLPETLEGWKKIRLDIREKFLSAMALPEIQSTEVNYLENGKIDCDGYTIRKIAYQSRPGFYVTAALYVPDGDGPFPAVINMHGHWNQGHLAERVQQRGHILAKSGYVVLSPDVFGGGERGREEGAYEYHGGILGGLLYNVGETLAGCQLWDNMRGVDLLCSLPFVDPEKIGATGASGGGNQTMYLAAFDERVKAAVPVSSVGSFQSYIGGSNCVCECIPGGLQICEESAILALTAPRALLICNAFHDCNPTFFTTEAARSITEAEKIYRAYGVPENIQQRCFNTPHGYFSGSQEAMLGFFNFHLKNSGAGFPAELPAYTVCAEEDMRTFTNGSRPQNIIPIDRFIQERAADLKKNCSGTADELKQILKVPAKKIVCTTQTYSAGDWEKYTIEDEAGRYLPFLLKRQSAKRCRIIASPEGKKTIPYEIIQEALDSGDSVLVFEHYGCGECGVQQELVPPVMKQPNLSRALLWMGKTLMGEWCSDYLLAMEFIRTQFPGAEIVLSGMYEGGAAALYASILSPENIAGTDLIRAPYTWVPELNDEKLQEKYSMAICIPNILVWGDLDHAAKLAPGEVNFLNY